MLQHHGIQSKLTDEDLQAFLREFPEIEEDDADAYCGVGDKMDLHHFQWIDGGDDALLDPFAIGGSADGNKKKRLRFKEPVTDDEFLFRIDEDVYNHESMLGLEDFASSPSFAAPPLLPLSHVATPSPTAVSAGAAINNAKNKSCGFPNDENGVKTTSVRRNSPQTVSTSIPAQPPGFPPVAPTYRVQIDTNFSFRYYRNDRKIVQCFPACSSMNYLSGATDGHIDSTCNSAVECRLVWDQAKDAPASEDVIECCAFIFNPEQVDFRARDLPNLVDVPPIRGERKVMTVTNGNGNGRGGRLPSSSTSRSGVANSVLPAGSRVGHLDSTVRSLSFTILPEGDQAWILNGKFLTRVKEPPRYVLAVVFTKNGAEICRGFSTPFEVNHVKSLYRLLKGIKSRREPFSGAGAKIELLWWKNAPSYRYAPDSARKQEDDDKRATTVV